MDNVFENDADIEQGNLERAGNRIATLKKRGICLHGWINTTTCVCYDCNKTWKNEQEMFEEIDDLQLRYM